MTIPALSLVTFPGGATISGNNTLKVNQAVYFRADIGSSMPTELSVGINLTLSPQPFYSELYYVVAATATTFQVSAARGGTAISFVSTGIGNIYVQECWRITNVDSVNNRVTLDMDSTGLTAPTGGYMTYCMSRVYTNNLRYAGKFAPNLQGYIWGNAAPNSAYLNYQNAGGEFPSNFLIAGLGGRSGNVWNVLEPIGMSPKPPQWLAIIAYNH